MTDRMTELHLWIAFNWRKRCHCSFAIASLEDADAHALLAVNCQKYQAPKDLFWQEGGCEAHPCFGTFAKNGLYYRVTLDVTGGGRSDAS